MDGGETFRSFSASDPIRFKEICRRSRKLESLRPSAEAEGREEREFQMGEGGRAGISELGVKGKVGPEAEAG